MRTKLFSGKTKQEALDKAKTELNARDEELFYKEIYQKNKDKVEIEVITKEEIVHFLKDYVRNLLYHMNIEGNYEVSLLEKGCKIAIYSNNDSILIGKGGRTIEALTVMLRQTIENKFNVRFSIVLDVSDYRRKKDKNLEVVAVETAREVFKTGIEAKLEPMNSYQRRLVHSALTDNKFVYTESVGEEPNRSVVIKPKEE